MGPRFLLLDVVGVLGGDARSAASTPHGIGWRLLGPNNRELGRSVGLLDDLEACREQLDRLRAGLDAAAVVTARGRGGTGWWWRLTVGTEPIARSGRLFQRERECEYSVSQFIASVPTALVKWPSSAAMLPRVRAVAFAGRTGTEDEPGTASSTA